MECTFYEVLADKAALGYVLHSLHCLFLPSGEVCGVTFSDVFHILSIVNVRNEDTDFVWVLYEDFRSNSDLTWKMYVTKNMWSVVKQAELSYLWGFFFFLPGFPNVGKSSIINSIKKDRVCDVGPARGVTK